MNFFSLEVVECGGGGGGGGVVWGKEVRNSTLQKFSKTLSKNYLNSPPKIFGLVKITFRTVHATDFLCTQHLFLVVLAFILVILEGTP